MWIITCIICIFYASNASIVSNVSIASNVSNYSHYSHVYMRVMQVITCIIWSIHIICNFWNFEYLELNNNPIWLIWGEFEASIGSMQVMQAFNRGEAASASWGLAMQVYVDIWISRIFFWYSSMLNPSYADSEKLFFSQLF